MSMIDRISANILGFTGRYNPWTTTYGVARSLLAFGTLLTMVFNKTGILFRPTFGIKDVPSCVGFTKISLFCLFSADLEMGRYIAILILILVITGFYPRITAIFHWWVSFSIIASATIVDGGDQIAAVLTLLLLPVALTDNRSNHWVDISADDRSSFAKLTSYSALCAIRLQIAVLYFHAAVSKFNVAEWVDGTAVYYWFLDPMFGATSESRKIYSTVFSYSGVVAFFTWGTLVLEVLLATAIVLPAGHRLRKMLLPAGIVFHTSILFVHGLVSFFFSMAAALILLLVPANPGILRNRKLRNETRAKEEKFADLNLDA